MKRRKLVNMSRDIIQDYRDQAETYNKPPAKWIQFAELMMDMGYHVKYYQALNTVSKYLIVSRNRIGPGGVLQDHEQEYKVRFSNHKPSRRLEKIGTCDFFVGITNFGVTRTSDAVKDTLEYFDDHRQPVRDIV